MLMTIQFKKRLQ